MDRSLTKASILNHSQEESLMGKHLIVNEELHQKIRKICFVNNIKIQDLVENILSDTLEAETLQEIIKRIKARNTRSDHRSIKSNV